MFILYYFEILVNCNFYQNFALQKKSTNARKIQKTEVLTGDEFDQSEKVNDQDKNKLERKKLLPKTKIRDAKREEYILKNLDSSHQQL